MAGVGVGPNARVAGTVRDVVTDDLRHRVAIAVEHGIAVRIEDAAPDGVAAALGRGLIAVRVLFRIAERVDTHRSIRVVDRLRGERQRRDGEVRGHAAQIAEADARAADVAHAHREGIIAHRSEFVGDLHATLRAQGGEEAKKDQAEGEAGGRHRAKKGAVAKKRIRGSNERQEAGARVARRCRKRVTTKRETFRGVKASARQLVATA